jgi:hypothetical protein
VKVNEEYYDDALKIVLEKTKKKTPVLGIVTITDNRDTHMSFMMEKHVIIFLLILLGGIKLEALF